MSKKILVISEIFWPEGGGAELATYLLLNMLKKYGFKITVVTGSRDHSQLTGVKFYHTSLLGNFNRINRWIKIKLLMSRAWFKKLLRIHDILYIPLSAYPLIPLAKKLGKKVIVHAHNFSPVRYYGVKYYFESNDNIPVKEELRIGLLHEYFINKNLLRTILYPLSFSFYLVSKKWLSHADTIICVSHRQAEIFEKQEPALRRKIKVIYNLLPEIPRQAKSLSEIPLILYTGGDNYIKGYHIMLKLLITLHRKGHKFKALMLNNYNEKNLNILMRLRYVLNGRLQIVGRVSHDVYLKLHRRAWSILFPSICEEPMPYSVLEAAILGTIPIAPKAGGVYEILKDTVAEDFLYTPLDLDEIVLKTEKLLSLDRRDILRIGKELREEVIEKYKSSSSTEELIKVFDA